MLKIYQVYVDIVFSILLPLTQKQNFHGVNAAN
jgi:hypothetical protein